MRASRLQMLAAHDRPRRAVSLGVGDISTWFWHFAPALQRFQDTRALARNGGRRLAGLHFFGSSMRGLRFELSPKAQAQDRVGGAFGHISFITTGSTGFDALRDMLRGIQKSGRLRFTEGLRVIGDLPYLMRAAYWRYVRHQLLWPQTAQYEMHIVVEQLPEARNRITLAEETDAFGCRLAAIDWHVGNLEMATAGAFARRFESYWRLEAIADIDWIISIGDHRFSPDNSASDVFHPGGTTRMGNSGRDAVVDSKLRTFSVPNLSVASTSVFPSGGSANPTLMLMLLALRLSTHLAEQIGRQR